MVRLGSLTKAGAVRAGSALWLAVGFALLMTGCGGSSSTGSGGGSNPPTIYVLTVNSASPTSGVTIGATPADNNGATSGTTSFTRTYNSGTSVTLTAAPTSGSNSFSSWSGCTTSAGATCTVAMNANVTVTATYAATAPTTYTLTVNSASPNSGIAITAAPSDNNGAGNGTTSFTRTYNAGTAVTLTAAATSGSNSFSSWSGCTASTGATCTIAMNSSATVTATYTPMPPTTYTLTVNSSNPSNGVGIGAAPADNNGKTAGTTGYSLTYNAGTSVTLTAPATSGSNLFSSWTGCTTSSGETCMEAMSANTTVTANYVAPTPTVYTLMVNSTNPASAVAITATPTDNNNKISGTTSFTLSYNSGTSVTLTAPATSGGNAFSSWSGCTTSSTVTCTVTMNANTTVTANYSATYVLTVDSTNPSSGVAITLSPADNNNAGSGTTSFTRTYNPGTVVTLQAANTSGGSNFSSWTGCNTTTGQTCNVVVNANTTVTATYATSSITSLTVSPNPTSINVGATQQFTATVVGTGTYSNTVTWTVTSASGATSSPGTIGSTSGLYVTPYPAPTSVTVTATSTQDNTKSASVTFALAPPATAAGPALSVDVGDQTHAISPYIYGMNAYLLDSTTAANANITVARWGGDDTSRYNYQNNITNSANDYYFENFNGASGMLGGSSFPGFVSTTDSLGIAPMGTVPLLGYVSNGTQNACSFTKAAYPDQQLYDPGGNCGNGVLANGTSLNGNSPGNPTTTPALTSIAEPPPTAPGAGGNTASWANGTWIGGWVNSIVTADGAGNPSSGARKGVAIWDLDNEPAEWDSVHRDVHPLPFTYDELTNGGIGAALAIKAADPTAQVSGPVMDRWDNYFYSEKDVVSGWATGKCNQFWSDPVDREAHGGVPLIEYYMQQMTAASATYGMRLLDYVDLHTYFSANYNGATVGFTTAGNTAEQTARVNSTRVFWDPTYTDPAYEQPNYPTDANYQTSCTNPAQAPAIIPMMQGWVARDYPGTKTSIDEYNWGGTESINGAVAQADILGIFGKYGLDMGMLWPTTNYNTQSPANEAFAIYRNYDGNKSTFGDMALNSTSANQGLLSVYGGLRTADNKITVVVINKTYGDLTSTLSIANYAAGTGATAQAYLYSNANLGAILAQTPVPITPPGTGSTTSTISTTFPAQSITLLVIP